MIRRRSARLAAVLFGLAAGACRGRRDPPPFDVPPAAMKDSGYRVVWQGHTFPAAVPAAARVRARVVFRNAGTEVWSGSVHAVFYFIREGSPPAEGRDAARRLLLQRPVSPGQTVTLERFEVETPTESGSYRLVFDLVNENVAWFSDRGAPRSTIPVRVE